MARPRTLTDGSRTSFSIDEETRGLLARWETALELGNRSEALRELLQRDAVREDLVRLERAKRARERRRSKRDN